MFWPNYGCFSRNKPFLQQCTSKNEFAERAYFGRKRLFRPNYGCFGRNKPFRPNYRKQFLQNKVFLPDYWPNNWPIIWPIWYSVAHYLTCNTLRTAVHGLSKVSLIGRRDTGWHAGSSHFSHLRNVSKQVTKGREANGRFWFFLQGHAPLQKRIHSEEVMHEYIIEKRIFIMKHVINILTDFNVICRFETFLETRSKAEATRPRLDHSERRWAQRRLWRRPNHQWEEEKGAVDLLFCWFIMSKSEVIMNYYINCQLKVRTTFTGRQIFELEKMFENRKYLSSSERADMAKLLNVTEQQVRLTYSPA